ncbi:hypothetical protein BDR07DRAFT_1385886 [Suillus spraguei]|nr:hypothetical protein BDR07DRAFT_1385886 [Suillus spraguei]
MLDFYYECSDTKSKRWDVTESNGNGESGSKIEINEILAKRHTACSGLLRYNNRTGHEGIGTRISASAWHDACYSMSPFDFGSDISPEAVLLIEKFVALHMKIEALTKCIPDDHEDLAEEKRQWMNKWTLATCCLDGKT